MSIIADNLKAYLSGGAANTDPDSSLGGVISTTEFVDDTLNNLFDDVTGDEHTAGDINYRCFYLKNTNGTDTAEAFQLWIESNTPAADDNILIGLDPAGIEGTATTIANETIAPSGVTFTEPSDVAPFEVGDLAAGEVFAVWVKRVVTTGTEAFADNNAVFKVKVQTL